LSFCRVIRASLSIRKKKELLPQFWGVRARWGPAG
jgi:hypothetical protein